MFLIGIRVANYPGAGQGHLNRCINIRKHLNQKVVWFLDKKEKKVLNLYPQDKLFIESKKSSIDKCILHCKKKIINLMLIDSYAIAKNTLEKLNKFVFTAIILDSNKKIYANLIISPQPFKFHKLENVTYLTGTKFAPIDFIKRKNSIIRNSRIVNKAKTKIVSNKIVKKYKASFVGNNESIFILGLSYKANVGDFRESPSLEIISNIKSKIRGKIYVNDPYIKNFKEKNIKVCSVANGFRKAKIIVILVPHKEYKNLDLHIKKSHIVLDECNVLNKGR